MKTVYDVRQLLKRFSIFIYTGNRIADLDLMEDELKDLDTVIFAVPHKIFLEKYNLENIRKLYKNEKRVLIDIKSIFSQKEAEALGYFYWSL